MRKTIIWASVTLTLLACARMPQAGRLEDNRLIETSGLAATRAGEPGYWALNDGGNGSVLYRLDARGVTRARVQVLGARNRDWEDLASFNWRGKPWLLIGDIGDNAARRGTVQLHLLLEPQIETERVRPTATLAVRYPDGPRDAEGLAVDTVSESIFVLSKRDQPHRLYRLPLSAFDTPTARPVFEFVGTVPVDVPDVAALMRKPELLAIGRYSTAFDISPDGQRALVLGYRRVRTVTRQTHETWTEAFSRLEALPDHALAQAEAAAFNRDGDAVTVTSEGSHAPLLTQPLPPR